MWKWLTILVLLVILLVPSPALADTSDTVTITAMGYVCGAPGGLTLYYISDYELGISWVKGVDAVNTMIRVKDSSVPTSRTDGNLVYYGDGTNAIDTGVNFEESAATKYYRAWSQNADGLWEEVGASNLMENPIMLLIALVVLAMGFTISSAILKKGYLAFAGAGSWMVTSIYCFSKSTADWDVYFSLAFLFIGLLLASAFSPMAWRETTPAKETTEEPDVTELREEMEAFDRERNQYSFLFSNKKRAKGKETRFQRTKEE